MPTMPWRTIPAAPPAAKREPSPPAGSIIAAPSPSPYDWAMSAITYAGPVLYTVRFGTADETAAPVNTLAIAGNDAGVLSVDNSGLVVVVTKAAGATLTIADTVATQAWTQARVGGPAGCEMHLFMTWLEAHVATDVLTVTSDIPTEMIGAAFELTEPGNGYSVADVNKGHSTAAWVANPNTGGGDAVPVIASPNGQPLNPAGFTFGSSLLGAALPLFLTVSRGTPPALRRTRPVAARSGPGAPRRAITPRGGPSPASGGVRAAGGRFPPRPRPPAYRGPREQTNQEGRNDHD